MSAVGAAPSLPLPPTHDRDTDVTFPPPPPPPSKLIELPPPAARKESALAPPPSSRPSASSSSAAPPDTLQLRCLRAVVEGAGEYDAASAAVLERALVPVVRDNLPGLRRDLLDVLASPRGFGLGLRALPAVRDALAAFLGANPKRAQRFVERLHARIVAVDDDDNDADPTRDRRDRARERWLVLSALDDSLASLLGVGRTKKERRDNSSAEALPRPLADGFRRCRNAVASAAPDLRRSSDRGGGGGRGRRRDDADALHWRSAGRREARTLFHSQWTFGS